MIIPRELRFREKYHDGPSGPYDFSRDAPGRLLPEREITLMSNVFLTTVTGILFLGGLWLFGLAFTVTSNMLLIFLAGVLLVTFALMIPFHLLEKIG